MVLKVLEKMAPTVLDEHGPYSGDNFVIQPQYNGAIVVYHIWLGGWSTLAEFQLYSAKGTMI